MESDLKIRLMTLKDLHLVFQWTEELAWHFCSSDAESFIQADPNGFFIGEINEKPICSIAAIKYGTYCYWTFFIVQEEHRGKGYGRKMLAHALEYSKDSEILSLNCIPCNFEIYHNRKYGFKNFCSLLCHTKKAEGTMDKELVKVTEDMIDEISEYDMTVFGYPRKQLLKALITRKDGYCLAVVRDCKVIGFGVMRKNEIEGQEEYYLGPVNADNEEIASKILEGLQSYVSGMTVWGQILDYNKDAIEIMGRQGWTCVDEADRVTRMYARGMPKGDLKRLYLPLDEIS